MTYDQQAKNDRACATFADTMPSFWRRLYLNCIAEGFTDVEAFRLLQTLIIAQFSNRTPGID